MSIWLLSPPRKPKVGGAIVFFCRVQYCEPNYIALFDCLPSAYLMVHNGPDDGRFDMEHAMKNHIFHRAHNQVVTYSNKRFLFRDVRVRVIPSRCYLSFAEVFY